MLHVNCVHSQRQRLLVLAHGNKTRTQVAEKVHIEHFMTLSLKLLRRPLQQRNTIAKVVLKEELPTSEPTRDRMERLQGVGYREVG
jgi:hypothetical protein